MFHHYFLPSVFDANESAPSVVRFAIEENNTLVYVNGHTVETVFPGEAIAVFYVDTSRSTWLCSG